MLFNLYWRSRPLSTTMVGSYLKNMDIFLTSLSSLKNFYSSQSVQVIWKRTRKQATNRRQNLKNKPNQQITFWPKGKKYVVVYLNTVAFPHQQAKWSSGGLNKGMCTEQVKGPGFLGPYSGLVAHLRPPSFRGWHIASPLPLLELSSPKFWKLARALPSDSRHVDSPCQTCQDAEKLHLPKPGGRSGPFIESCWCEG